MSPRASAISTSDDFKPTIFNGGENASWPSTNWRFSSVGRLLAWAYTQPYVRVLFVGDAYASPLSLTLDKYWFLWTEFSTYRWKISTLSRASALWTGFCELSGGVVTLWTGKWKPHQALSLINIDCATGSTAAYNTTIRVFERSSTFNPASAVLDAPAHVPLALLSPLWLMLLLLLPKK